MKKNTRKRIDLNVSSKIQWLVKPKFHYADFPWRPQQTRDVPIDLFATSPTSRVLSRTSPISPFPWRKRAGCRLVAGIFQNISRHVVMVWNPKHPSDFSATRNWSMSSTSHWQVADFRETSPWHVLRESFGEVGVMEFGLQPAKLRGSHRQTEYWCETNI